MRCNSLAIEETDNPTHQIFLRALEGPFQGSLPPRTDFETSIFLGAYYPVGYNPVNQFNFDIGFPVGPFVNELISKNNAFAGFSIRPGDYNVGDTTLNHMDASLIITTVDVAEPVPEPTTIFGSALALSLGGWLKRKNLSRFNKTTLQHLGIS
jgi:hypothetical protein